MIEIATREDIEKLELIVSRLSKQVLELSTRLDKYEHLDKNMQSSEDNSDVDIFIDAYPMFSDTVTELLAPIRDKYLSHRRASSIALSNSYNTLTRVYGFVSLQTKKDFQAKFDRWPSSTLEALSCDPELAPVFLNVLSTEVSNIIADNGWH